MQYQNLNIKIIYLYINKIMTTNKLMNQNLYQQKMNQSASELFPFKKQSSIIPYQKQLFQPP